MNYFNYKTKYLIIRVLYFKNIISLSMMWKKKNSTRTQYRGLLCFFLSQFLEIDGGEVRESEKHIVTLLCLPFRDQQSKQIHILKVDSLLIAMNSVPKSFNPNKLLKEEYYTITLSFPNNFLWFIIISSSLLFFYSILMTRFVSNLTGSSVLEIAVLSTIIPVIDS